MQHGRSIYMLEMLPLVCTCSATTSAARLITAMHLSRSPTATTVTISRKSRTGPGCSRCTHCFFHCCPPCQRGCSSNLHHPKTASHSTMQLSLEAFPFSISRELHVVGPGVFKSQMMLPGSLSTAFSTFCQAGREKQQCIVAKAKSLSTASCSKSERVTNNNKDTIHALA